METDSTIKTSEGEGKSPQTKEQAFEALMLRHKALIWHLCSDFRMDSVYTVEDKMQEVVCSLWQYFDTFEGRSSERTWVYRVSVSTLLMLARKRRIETAPIDEVATDSLADEVEHDAYQHLRQCIELLPETDRVVLRAHLDGFSYVEIGKITHLTVPAVAMRLTKAKHKLRQMMLK